MKTDSSTHEPEDLAAGLSARLSVPERVGQSFSDKYRKAVTATAKRHRVSEAEVEDAYIAQGIARLHRESEPSETRMEEIVAEAA